MTITITAFERSPDGGKGLARDTRVRWALEEVGQPYKVRLVSFRAMKEPAHLALHPFGQIPTYEEGDLALFETGAIVFHIAERHAGLLPVHANARARAITWMFAAVNTVEPPILELGTAKLLEGDKPWNKEPAVVSARAPANVAQAIASAAKPRSALRFTVLSPMGRAAWRRPASGQAYRVRGRGCVGRGPPSTIPASPWFGTDPGKGRRHAP
jgi:hypothetical protein